MARDECDNGELQPDPEIPSGGTPAAREHGHRLEHHNRQITATTPTEPESTQPEQE
jgi:hypothetical protein